MKLTLNEMSGDVRKPVFGLLTTFHTNWPVLSQKQAGTLKFRIYKEDGLYYLCIEKKGADQLSLFSHGQNSVFS